MNYGSDHLPILLTFWDYKKTDWDCFRRSCHIGKIFEDLNDSIDALDNGLLIEINNALKISTPLITPDPTKRKKPVWWNVELQNLFT